MRFLLQALRPRELDSVRTYLSAFHNMYGEYEPKTLRLLDYLLANPRHEASLVKNIISPEATDNTFRMLITRLKDKIYEVLTLDLNLGRGEDYSLAYQAKVKGRKALTQAEILHTRGLYDETRYLLSRTTRLARKYECFDVWQEVLQFQSTLAVLKEGPEAGQKQREKLSVVRDKQDLLYKAKTAYYRYASARAFQPQDASYQEAQSTLADLRSQLSAIPCDRARYWCFLLELNCLQDAQRYAEALRLSLDFLAFIKEHPPVTMPRRLGTGYIHLCHSLLAVGELERSMAMGERSTRYFEEDSFNHQLAREYIALALLRLGRTREAADHLRSLLKRSKELPVDFHWARRKYLQAIAHFMNGHHRKAHLSLQQTTALDKDRNGWNVGVRILTILNQIDWGGLRRPTEAFVENLHVHLRETSRHQFISPRQQAILSCLRFLVLESFSFKKAGARATIPLASLRKGEGCYQWDPFGPECLRFDVWFDARINGECDVGRTNSQVYNTTLR